MKKIKISELPLFSSFKGLFTIGTDDKNRSVKVPLDVLGNVQPKNDPTLATKSKNTTEAVNELHGEMPRKLGDLPQDALHRTVTDTEKSVWNAKQEKLESGVNIKSVDGTQLLGEGNLQIDKFTKQEIIDMLANYVKKINGKQLSTEDFTSAFKLKLESLQNYDDTQVRNSIDTISKNLETLISGDPSVAIESFNEIIAFLKNVEDTQTLEGIIAGIEQQIAERATSESVNVKNAEQDAAILANKNKLSTHDTELEKKIEDPAEDDNIYVRQFKKWKVLHDVSEFEHGLMTPEQERELRVLSSLIPDIEDKLSYGVTFDSTVSSPTCTRIGNTDLHKTLPVQNGMRGCLLDDNGAVVKYLDDKDWSAEVRDGSQGQVMVEIPSHYRKCEKVGTKYNVRISKYPLPGYLLVSKSYVSAYHATLQRSTKKLSSVVNNTEDYRGGNNQADWDNTFKNLLGRPVTVISRTNFRTYARNRNGKKTSEWNCMLHQTRNTIYWLFVTEYATLNCQSGFNAELTPEGLHQGGLGAGVSEFWDWSKFNGYYPFVPCGHTDSLGNGTGVVPYSLANDDNTITHTCNVPRYRGIENPFGHIWNWEDGINIRISADVENGGDGLSKVFICENPELFTDKGYDGYTHIGNEARENGYVKEIIFDKNGDIMPIVVGGGSSTYFCDYHYTNIPTAGESLRGVYFGGSAHRGAYDGLVYSGSAYSPAFSDASIGSRLCFIPRIPESANSK